MNNFISYFKRLNIDPTKPLFALVQALQKKHLETFSFNNIVVLLGKEISLDIENVVEKIVHKNHLFINLCVGAFSIPTSFLYFLGNLYGMDFNNFFTSKLYFNLHRE